MENSPANQLPEVDSLPDGFVESSVESSTPRTPKFEQEDSPEDYKDTFLELNRPNDPSSLSDSVAVDEIGHTESKIEKGEKLRTFPVPLSEKDGTDSFGDPLEVPNKGCVGDGVCGSMVTPESGNAVSEASLIGASLSETMGSSIEHKEHVEGDCQGSIRTAEGCSELKASNLKEISTPESAESLKNRKLRCAMLIPTINMNLVNKLLYELYLGEWGKEITDVKRKTVKRGFKTEREFLEFTLKYQQVIAERDAATTIRDKLESLCRELQRQNKMLMEECKRVSTEGQNMRLELSTKFHDAIKDVSSKLDGQKDECLSQLKENEMLRNKLKHLSEQYAVSEQQYTQKLKQKSLELQIADLKIQQHEEKLTHEQSQMKLYAEQAEQVSQLLATEKNLRLQLAADGEKFQQFQDALLKSNEVFETFKQEIEKMAKSIKELKKENIFLKGKCERTDITLIELVGEREHMKKQLEKMKNQKEKLESLCRSLQAERKQSSIASSSSDSVSFSSKMGIAEEEVKNTEIS